MNATQQQWFPNGARWLRADFHLHTQADQEFVKPPAGTNFVEAYVGALQQARVGLGVLTNHNKFDRDEYRALRKAAEKAGIFLLPGVELSVQGGSTGVHILIAFDPASWVFNRENTDFINRLLDAAFEHVPNRESENTACAWTLSQTLEKLDEHRQNGRDSFVVLAHVDDAKGAFEELGAGLKSHFNELFVRSVLAVQKARSQNNWNNLRQWLDADWQPARVEGSDCKRLEDVGRAHVEGGVNKETWLKLGAFTFESVRLALVMKDQRVATSCPQRQAGLIQSIKWIGAAGLMDGREIALSSDLSNVIGIRGSGKSSLLESLRYVFDVPLPPNAEDADYKETLVQRTLGSGGKVIAELTTRDGTVYRVERIFGDSPKVFRNGQAIPNLRPSGVLKVRYFGQKDLAKFGESRFARELVERFAGREEEDAQTAQLRAQIEQRLVTLAHGQSRLAKREEIVSQLAEIEEDLKRFKQHGLEDKLKEQIALEKDLDQANSIVELEQDVVAAVGSLMAEYRDALQAAAAYKAAADTAQFDAVQKSLQKFITAFDQLKTLLRELKAAQTETGKAREKVSALLASKKEKFAEIRAGLHLKGELSPDTFIQLSKRKQNLEAQRKELETLQTKQGQFEQAMRQDLIRLQQLWQTAHQQRLEEIKRLNSSSVDLRIELKFKGDKNAFIERLSSLVSGLQRRTLQKVVEAFSDGVELYLDLFRDGKGCEQAGLTQEQIVKIREGLAANLKELITWRPPDQVNIFYKGNPLHQHSVGQRATALMLFLLSQEDFDVLIVDQPEDDLDNETLYEEVIKRLLGLKGKRQIIFSTHSPNIPVLGDAEQVVRCQYAPSHIETVAGSIDDPQMQQEIIRVMEGGKDAFRRRQQIYETWKLSNSSN